MKDMLTWKSQIGWIRIVAGDRGLRRIEFHSRKESFSEKGPEEKAGPQHDATRLLKDARRQIDAYLAGTATDFDLPLDLDDLSPFTRKVLQELTRIPYGTTISYAELGRMAGFAGGAARAVGRVMAANPLPIVVPCHRVIAASGRFGGYSGGEGPESKRRLLELEGALASSDSSGNDASAMR